MVFSCAIRKFVIEEKQNLEQHIFLSHWVKVSNDLISVLDYSRVQFECFNVAVFIGITWVPESCIRKDMKRL